jgi:hypothetical protein
MVMTDDRVHEEAPGGEPPGGEASPSAAYRGCTAEERRTAFGQLSALVASVQAELCAIAVAADAEGDAAADGLRIDGWVGFHGGLTGRHARELLRVGKALEELPAIRAGLASGELSWDKAVAATKLAEPGIDALVADEARDHSADEIAYLASRVRARSRADQGRAEAIQRLNFRTDESHDGGFVSGWLSSELFARLTQVIDDEAERLGPDDDGRWSPLPQRRAHALDSIVAAYQPGQRDPDRARLVLRTRDEILTGEIPGNVELNRSVLSGIDTLHRLACCAEIIFQVHAAVGDAMHIRREHREPNRAMRRYLTDRDGRCRFPGCDCEIRHFHHMIHWIHGGPTDTPNLLGLCWRHHHLVHEGAWTVTGDADGLVTFHAPDGRRLDSRTPPLDPDLRRRAARAARRRRRRQDCDNATTGASTGPPR